MLKPKSQVFKLKFHLAKVEAVNNKVNSKVHAYLHIDNQQLEFKGAPQLKKNIAIFGSDLQYDNFMIGFDQITGLYQQKKVLLVIEFQTQGAYIKVGQVNINVGEILNEKKYRVVNIYPLSKCYDKSAKVKLAVDFIPISQKRDNLINNKKGQSNVKTSSLTVQRKQQITTSNVGGLSNIGSNGFYKNPTGAIKSRLAEQQNVILQQRVYEYEKRMDNYRIAQNQLSQRMQQQLQRKDDKISELSLQLTKQQNIIHLITLQNQSFKSQIQSLNQQYQMQKIEIKSHLATIQSLQKNIQSKQKQIESKNQSLQNLNRTKQNKQKYLTLEIQKYTNKYSQSQQERNKIIFELESKLKIQLQRKDQHYQELLNINQAKYLENLKAVKERNKYLETSFKELEDLSEQQDNKIKGLTLQLQKSVKLTHQQQQQMIYLNQQFGKVKKQRQSLTNELDSINFSYQQASAQLLSQKQLVKQMVRKIQILKTQLSLSNQTVDEQRERIIVMSKDIQVHQQRQYYMKEHYQEEIYDREMTQHNVRGQKQQLQMQIKKYKQQLKLSEEKYQQEHTKNQLLKSSTQSLERQLSNKNASLMKLGEQKIYLQTQTKNSKILINQLQQQLSKIQQQKAMLSEALMQKKMALQNDKSLQWTYKIQSLQNDIQLMVEKFKNEKQQMKQNHRKQQLRKMEEINKFVQLNKKLKEDLDEIREKYTKKQSTLISLQKALSSQKQKFQQIDKQFSSIKQTYRLVNNDKQIMQQNIKQLTKNRQSKDKLIEELQKKSQKYKKDLTTIKNGFNRLISLILEYMVKRYNERVNFQDISSSNVVDLVVDGEIVGYVNVALKKFCDDHNKTRQMIKQLEEYKRQTLISNGQLPPSGKNNRSNKYIQQNGYDNRNYQQDQDFEDQNYANIKRSNYQYQQNNQQSAYYYNKRAYINNRGEMRSVSPNNRLNPKTIQSYYSNDPVKQLQSYRFELDRMKKQQAEWKVKIKTLQEQIQKHQRQLDNEKFEKNRVKNQLQQAQDEITKINFTLRKKDKIIKQMEMQLQDVQKQNFQLKANPTYVIQKAKQKMSASLPISSQPNSLPIIKDLQSKLNIKSQQLTYTQKQVQSLRQQYLLQLNQIKKLQLKLKQKSNKILNLEKQLQAQNVKKYDDKDKEIMRLKKQVEKQAEERESIQDRVKELENVLQEYELEVNNLENRNKQLQQQIKSCEIQIRRNHQSNQYKMNDKATFYETQILQFKSQLSQQRDKVQQLVQKNSHLNVSLAKKIKQLQLCRQKLQSKEKQFLLIEEEFEDYKNKMVLKQNDLNDKIRELEMSLQGKSFELEECRFAYEGRVLDLQRQIDDFRDGLLANGGINNNGR